MVETDVVDGLDRGFGIGVGGEQGPLGGRVQLEGLSENVDAGDPWHPLVNHHQGDRSVLQGEGAQRLDRLLAAAGPDDSVIRRGAGPQIALHCLNDFRLVVDRDDDRLGFVHLATTASGKQNFQVSPGSRERITG